MNVPVRRVRQLLAITATAAVLIVVAANVPSVRDALAVVVAVGLVMLFFGIRVVANWLRHPDDREYELWGGMTETTREVAARHERPGGNPGHPDAPLGLTGLPDAAPSYHGHPLGRSDEEDASTGS